MRFLFDLESPVMQIISRICDIVVLNLVFLLTCLPVFTIGAANAALYATVIPMDTEKEGKLLRTYFQAFRENFRQGTAIWAVLAVFGGATYYNMVRLSQIGGTAGYVLVVAAAAVLVVLVGIFTWVFPLLSQFRNTVPNMLLNALKLSIGNLPRTLAAAAVHVFPWVLLIVNLYTFIRISFLWFSLYFAAAAYWNSRVLKKVLDALK